MKYLLLVLVLLLQCTVKPPEQRSPLAISEPSTLDSIPVYHLQLPVHISIRARASEWKAQKISFADTCQVIALLIEKHQHVKSGDILASVWNMSHPSEFTPIDIFASLEGIVTEVNYQLQDKIIPQTPFIIIKDFRYLLIRTAAHPTIAKHLRKGQPVTVLMNTHPLRATLYKMDTALQSMEVLIANNDYISPDSVFTGRIDCGNIKGDFIPMRYFNQADTLSAFVDPEFPLLIKKVAECDSLAMIFPALPEKTFLIAVKKNLDL